MRLHCLWSVCGVCPVVVVVVVVVGGGGGVNIVVVVVVVVVIVDLCGANVIVLSFKEIRLFFFFCFLSVLFKEVPLNIKTSSFSSSF